MRRLSRWLELQPASARPSQVHLSVTDRCFLPCVHCHISRQHDVRDLPTATWLRLIDRLSAWTGPAGANFVGGEPLMRNDLETLMARAVSRGWTVTFNTNGWLLTARRARSLAASGASIAYLALDGVRAETVDATRGRAGAFERAMAALSHLEKVGSPRVVVATILHGRNAAEIPALLEMVLGRGHQLVVQPLYQTFGETPYDPRWYLRSPLWPQDPAVMDAALDVLLDGRRKERGVCNSIEQLTAMKAYFRDPVTWNGLTCRAGHTDLAIDPRGQLRLCFNREPVADLDAPSWAWAWNGPVAQRRRYEITTCKRSCNLLNCNFDRP